MPSPPPRRAPSTAATTTAAAATTDPPPTTAPRARRPGHCRRAATCDVRGGGRVSTVLSHPRGGRVRPTTKILLAAVLVLAAALLPAATAAARAGDRNHDRIPDRWEKRNHLSLKVKQTHRDQDRDGLNNLGEFRSRTDPRDADSDEDGIKDGKEDAGTVTAFDGTSLTITLFAGGDVTGMVTPDTELECRTATETERGERGDDDQGDDDQGEDDHGDDDRAHDSADDPGDDGDEQDEDEPGEIEDDRCPEG